MSPYLDWLCFMYYLEFYLIVTNQLLITSVFHFALVVYDTYLYTYLLTCLFTYLETSLSLVETKLGGQWAPNILLFPSPWTEITSKYMVFIMGVLGVGLMELSLDYALSFLFYTGSCYIRQVGFQLAIVTTITDLHLPARYNTLFFTLPTKLGTTKDRLSWCLKRFHFLEI